MRNRSSCDNTGNFTDNARPSWHALRTALNTRKRLLLAVYHGLHLRQATTTPYA